MGLRIETFEQERERLAEGAKESKDGRRRTGVRPKKMLAVGVFGGIGSGKSLLCGFLEEFGAEVVSGDRIGHDLLNDEEIKGRIVEAFGEEILDENREISREKLGRSVFSDRWRLSRLNGLIHPRIIDRVREKVGEFRSRGTGVGVVDAALIPEWGIEKEFDVCVFVDAPREVRESRWLAKTGGAKEEFEDREKAQMPPEEKERRARIRVRNRGSREDLREKAKDLWNVLKETETLEEGH